MQPRHFIISRTDSIGDVVLTLPLAGILKRYFPTSLVTFLGQPYTRPVIEACPYVDVFRTEAEFLQTTQWEGAGECALLHVFPKKELAVHAQKLGIGMRIGTRSRWYHWPTCNQLLWLKRKRSDLHEAQLNATLLAPLGLPSAYALTELSETLNLQPTIALPEKFKTLLEPDKQHLILHPKSKGSALEWGLDRFAALANALDPGRYQLFISGTAEEGKVLAPFFTALQRPVIDITGQLTLAEFIAFIAACDGLVANSTGPLHLAAALGKQAIGLYPSIRPMHAGRWAPLGAKSVTISAQEGDQGMSSISVTAVLDGLMS